MSLERWLKSILLDTKNRSKIFYLGTKSEGKKTQQINFRANVEMKEPLKQYLLRQCLMRGHWLVSS